MATTIVIPAAADIGAFSSDVADLTAGAVTIDVMYTVLA